MSSMVVHLQLGCTERTSSSVVPVLRNFTTLSATSVGESTPKSRTGGSSSIGGGRSSASCATAATSVTAPETSVTGGATAGVAGCCTFGVATGATATGAATGATALSPHPPRSTNASATDMARDAVVRIDDGRLVNMRWTFKSEKSSSPATRRRNSGGKVYRCKDRRCVRWIGRKESSTSEGEQAHIP